MGITTQFLCLHFLSLSSVAFLFSLVPLDVSTDKDVWFQRAKSPDVIS